MVRDWPPGVIDPKRLRRSPIAATRRSGLLRRRPRATGDPCAPRWGHSGHPCGRRRRCHPPSGAGPRAAHGADPAARRPGRRRAAGRGPPEPTPLRLRSRAARRARTTPRSPDAALASTPRARADRPGASDRRGGGTRRIPTEDAPPRRARPYWSPASGSRGRLQTGPRVRGRVSVAQARRPSERRRRGRRRGARRGTGARAGLGAQRMGYRTGTPPTRLASGKPLP